MAHTRQRQVGNLFAKLIRFSPIVGIFGHRQVGKTTFASSVAARYWTMDDRSTRLMISADPRSFLEKQRRFPTVIDECQIEPDLFPALKEHVRLHKRPGQFVLTGSVRFTSRKAIRESLAGRMSSIELLPFILSELTNEPLPEVVPNLVEAREFRPSTLEMLKSHSEAVQTQRHLEKYLTHGGLPGLCFVREDRLRREGLLAVHQLILDRDLRMLVGTKISIESLLRWMGWIAANGWNSYNASEVKRQFGFAHVTQKNLLYALESIFLIRRIPITSTMGEVILFEDQFEERALSEDRLLRGEQILSAFFRNARAQFQYRVGDTTRFESYWTRSDARVPLVFRNPSGVLGVVVISSDQPSRSQQRSAESFLRREPSGKVVFLADKPIKAEIIDARMMLSPAAALI